jgi:hypothetical protein
MEVMKELTASAIIAVVLLAAPVFATYSGGSGEPNDPWQISCPNDLLYLGSHPADYNSSFILTADINLAGYTFTTAVIAPDIDNSTWEFEGTSFKGKFDGNNFVIRNLTIDTNGTCKYNLGLFGQTDSGCEIKNLGIEHVNIKAGNYSGSLGGLVGCNGSTISNCYATATVTGGDNSWSLGGLVGENYGGTVNCYSTATVTGGDKSNGLGGLVGSNYVGKTISGCYSTATVIGGDDSSYLGGLTGVGDCRNCFAKGAVTGGNDSNYIGGLVGRGNCTYCFATGAVNGGNSSQYLGGLVGYGSNNLSNCYATGAVNGGNSSQCLGGLVGSATATPQASSAEPIRSAA